MQGRKDSVGVHAKGKYIRNAAVQQTDTDRESRSPTTAPPKTHLKQRSQCFGLRRSPRPEHRGETDDQLAKTRRWLLEKNHVYIYGQRHARQGTSRETS